MKTALFVDSPNQYYCVSKQFGGRKLDFKKLLIRWVDDNFARAYAYGVQFEGEARKFIAALQSFGYVTRFRDLRFRQQRVNVSVDLAVDAFKIHNNIDAIVLVASSPDYVPLIEFLKEHGVYCTVYASGICRELKQVADQYFELDESVIEEQPDVEIKDS